MGPFPLSLLCLEAAVLQYKYMSNVIDEELYFLLIIKSHWMLFLSKLWWKYLILPFRSQCFPVLWFAVS